MTLEAHYSADVFNAQCEARSEIKRMQNRALQERVDQLQLRLPSWRVEAGCWLAQEKGASNWLTALPIAEDDFVHHKSVFPNALALRYGWQPARLPLKCVCGSDFTVEHAMSCPHGGLPSKDITKFETLWLLCYLKCVTMWLLSLNFGHWPVRVSLPIYSY